MATSMCVHKAHQTWLSCVRCSSPVLPPPPPPLCSSVSAWGGSGGPASWAQAFPDLWPHCTLTSQVQRQDWTLMMTTSWDYISERKKMVQGEESETSMSCFKTKNCWLLDVEHLLPGRWGGCCSWCVLWNTACWSSLRCVQGPGL